MLDDRDNQRRVDIISAPPPEQVARQTRVAREAGLEPALVDDVDGAERAQQANRMTTVLGKYPAFGRWAAENPRGVAAAADDHETLSRIGDAFDKLKSFDPVMSFARAVDRFDRADTGSQKSYGAMTPVVAAVAAMMGDREAKAKLPTAIRQSPAALASGVARIAEGALGYLEGGAEVSGFKVMSALAGYGAGRAGQSADHLRPESGDWLTDQITGGVSNVPSTALGLVTGLYGRAVGLSLKGATLASTAIGGTVAGGTSYREAREQGLSANAAFAYGNVDAGIEIAGEYLGNSQFLRLTDAGASPLVRFVKSQWGEQAGEQFSTVAHDFNAWAVLPENRSKTFGDYIAARPGAAASTAVQTFVASGISNVAVTALEKGAQTYGERERQRKAAARLLPRAIDAMRARHDAAELDRLAKFAVASKFQTRDPEGYAGMLDHVADSAGVTHLYIPAEMRGDYLAIP